MKAFGKTLLFFITIASVCGITACTSHSPSDFSYRQKAFALQAEGNRWGEPLLCDIYCENGAWKTISYHAPDPLDGITVTAQEDGSLLILGKGLSATIPQDTPTALGLTLPARILLLDQVAAPRRISVQRISTGDLFSLSLPSEDQPITLAIGSDGAPLHASGAYFSFRFSPLSDPHSPAK